MNGYDTDMLTFGADQPDFTNSDAFVDTMVFGANTLLPLTIQTRPDPLPGAAGKIITQTMQIVNLCWQESLAQWPT